MTKRPLKVSVIIPAYNRLHTIEASLQSLINQKYRPLEVIVVDDGSSDGTWGLLQNLKFTDIEFKPIHQENAGAAAARNTGINASTGELIQFLDSDDLLDPNKLSEQVAVFENQPEVDVTYGHWQMGKSETSCQPYEAKQHADMVAALLSKYWHPNFSYLFRRMVVFEAGLWDTSLRINDDFDFALKVAMTGAKFALVPVNTGLYIWHPGERVSRQADSINAEDTYQILDNAIETLEKAGSLTAARTRVLAEYYWRLAVDARLQSKAIFQRGLEKSLKLVPDFKPERTFAKAFVVTLGYANAAAVMAAKKQGIKSVKQNIKSLLGERLSDHARKIKNR